MNKKAFKVGETIRRCEKCEAWVPAFKRRCDECGEEMPTGALEIITEEMLKEATEEKEINLAEEHLECVICHKKYPLGESECSCGGTLRFVAPAGVNAAPAKTNKIPHSAFGVQPQPKNAESGFFYTAFMYNNGQPLKARTSRVAFPQGSTVFGRYTFLKDARLFFDEYTRDDEERFSSISSENVVFTSEGDTLFVELINPEKSDVVVNRSRVLAPGEKLELHEGDFLRFGGGAMDDRCIDIEIHEAGQTNQRMVHDGMNQGEEYNQVLHRLEEHMKAQSEVIQSQNAVLEEQSATIAEYYSLLTQIANATGIQGERIEQIQKMSEQGLENDQVLIGKMEQIQADYKTYLQEVNRVARDEMEEIKNLDASQENDAAFSDRVKKLVPAIGEDAKKVVVQEFLKIPAPNGKVKECYRHLPVLEEHQQMFEYIYEAAFLEKVLSYARESSEGELEDYGPVANLIGKAFEQFVYVEVRTLIACSPLNEGTYMEYVKDKNFVGQGEVARFLRKYKGNDFRIKNLLNALGLNARDNDLIQRIDTALENIMMAIEFRNDNSHAEGSKLGKDGKDARTYDLGAKGKTLTYQDYLKTKYKVFTRESIDLLHQYYMRVRSRNGAAGKNS